MEFVDELGLSEKSRGQKPTKKTDRKDIPLQDPKSIVAQCDLLIEKHEQAISEILKIRKQAKSLIPTERYRTLNAWGDWVSGIREIPDS